MNLLHMNVNELLEIDAIQTSNIVYKKRLQDLGITPSNQIRITQFGLFKSTIMVAIGNTWIGLRKEEAKMIDVHRISS